MLHLIPLIKRTTTSLMSKKGKNVEHRFYFLSFYSFYSIQFYAKGHYKFKQVYTRF